MSMNLLLVLRPFMDVFIIWLPTLRPFLDMFVIWLSGYRRFGTAYRSHLRGCRNPRRMWGTDGCDRIQRMVWAVIGSQGKYRSTQVAGAWVARG